ncbi:MAG: hypothetical protein ACOCRO_05790 [Halanaerobiales bacterium]
MDLLIVINEEATHIVISFIFLSIQASEIHIEEYSPLVAISMNSPLGQFEAVNAINFPVSSGIWRNLCNLGVPSFLSFHLFVLNITFYFFLISQWI